MHPRGQTVEDEVVTDERKQISPFNSGIPKEARILRKQIEGQV